MLALALPADVLGGATVADPAHAELEERDVAVPHAERELASRQAVNAKKKQNRLRRQIAKAEKAIAKVLKTEEQIGTPEPERWSPGERCGGGTKVEDGRCVPEVTCGDDKML